MLTLSRFKNLPWATTGRRECFSDVLFKYNQQLNHVRLLKDKPKITFFVIQKKKETALSNTLESLKVQSYPAWECYVLSRHKEVSSYGDERIFHYSYKEDPLHIINELALKLSSDWISFLEEGDRVHPCALYHIFTYPNAFDFFYTNETFLKEPPLYYSKCDLSYFTLLHQNYIGRLWGVRRHFFNSVSGFPSVENFEHSLFLKVYEKTQNFFLVPYFLYFREEKPKQSLKTPKMDRDILRSKVSFIICFKNKSEWTLKCLDSLNKLKGAVQKNIFLVNNQSSPEEVNKIKDAIKKHENCIWVDYDEPFNYAHMHNQIIGHPEVGQFVFLLNNDVFLSSDIDLDIMVSWASCHWVGTVGIRLQYPDGRIQHGGFRCTFGGHSRMVMMGHAQEEEDLHLLRREVFGNTFAACLFRTELLKDIKLEELKYPNGYGDVAFNFECKRRGLSNIYLGDFSATHLESGSRGITYEYWEECAIEEKYIEFLQKMLRRDLGYQRIALSEKKFLFNLVKQKLKNRFIR